jgi:hypothetical protein
MRVGASFEQGLLQTARVDSHVVTMSYRQGRDFSPLGKLVYDLGKVTKK